MGGLFPKNASAHTMVANEGDKNTTVSFYWDDSDTVNFLVLLAIYVVPICWGYKILIGLMVGNVELWSAKTFVSEESNTRLDSEMDSHLKCFQYHFRIKCLIYIICAFLAKFRIKNKLMSFIVNY